MGSCVVYGGRRLGKTALLRHVAGAARQAARTRRQHRRRLCQHSRHRRRALAVWEYASRDLQAIFKTGPVRTAAEFAASIREWLDADARRRRPVWEITDRHVREVIEDVVIQKEIGDEYDFTIRGLDHRYQLVAPVVAERALTDSAAGRVDEGMSAVEVLDAACTWWPQAFEHLHQLETVNDLRDEIEELGVLRQTTKRTWALRSSAILRQLGDDDHVTDRLLDFSKMEPPRAFDPAFDASPPAVQRGRQGGRAPVSAHGGPGARSVRDRCARHRPVRQHPLRRGSGHRRAAHRRSGCRGRHPDECHRRAFTNLDDLLETIRIAARDSARRGASSLIAVDPHAAWDVSWIEAAMRQRPVRDGELFRLDTAIYIERLAGGAGPDMLSRIASDTVIEFAGRQGRSKPKPHPPP